MSIPVKITFTGPLKTTSTPVSFIAWNGRPQLPQEKCEFVTRLGGSKFIITNTMKQASMTPVTCFIVSANTEVNYAIKEVETQIKILLDNGGVAFTWTDEGSNTISPCYIVSVDGYQIKACDGAYRAIGTINMTVTVDTLPTGSTP